MNGLKQNPLFSFGLLLIVALLAGEIGLWTREREQTRQAFAALAQKKQERDRLAFQSPAMSSENERAILRDLNQTQEALVAWQVALQGKDAAILAGTEQAGSMELHFDIVAFVERTRALADRAQVTIPKNAYFGFATHANEGLEAGLVPAVFRQRVIGQYLVETLIDSHPLSLLAVQRERPLTEARRNRRNQAAPEEDAGAPAGGLHADFFDFDGRMAVRVPGILDSEAFRIEFTGQTAALRSFLNHLASFRLPAIVRRIEVEPVQPVAPTSDPAVAGGSAPWVTQNISRFTVVVEVVSPVVNPEASL